MINRWSTLSITTLLTLSLSSCDFPSPQQYKQETANINQNHNKLTSEEVKEKTPPPPVEVKKTAYVDTTPVPFDTTPGWLNRRVSISGNNLPFSFYMSQLLEPANIQVFYDNTINRGKPITVRYTGTLKGALDKLATVSDYQYTTDADTNQVTWSAFVTKTFDISFVPGKTAYTVGNSGSSGSNIAGGTGGSNVTYTGVDVTGDGQNSSLTGSLSLWDDITSTVKNLLSKDGTVQVSQSTTTVTVRDHPENVTSISEYVARMNKLLSMQVRLDVQILDVQLNKDFQYGIDWNKVLYSFSNGNSLSLSGNLGANATSILPTTTSPLQLTTAINHGPWSSTNFIVSALQNQGNVSVLNQPSVTTTNDQVAQITVQSQQSYIANVSNTITGGASAFSQNSINPGVVTSGLNLYLLPKIQGDKIYLNVSGTLSDLITLTNAATVSTGSPVCSDGSAPVNGACPTGTTLTNSGSVTIQVPTIAEKDFNQRSIVSNGETLIIAGFKNLRNQTQKSNVLGIDALGGKAGYSNNEELVVLITPTILSGEKF